MPWDPSCKNFILPDQQITSMNTALCGMYMPGCTILNICNNAKYSGMYPDFCKPFSIYKELCNDMPKMDSCSTYNKMCTSNSTIEQCSTKTLPLLHGKNYSELIEGICGSMDMDGCEICHNDKKCDRLKVYSDLCIQMDNMKQCDSWHSLCHMVSDWPLCANTLVPQMKMYFHTGINEYLLFQELVPQTLGQYLIAILLVFIVSFGYELLKLCRNKLTTNYRRKRDEKLGYTLGKILKWDKFIYVASNTSIYFLEICIGFLLMLLVMTYNLFICLAIIFGRLLGSFVCGCLDDDPTISSYSKDLECH